MRAAILSFLAREGSALVGSSRHTHALCPASAQHAASCTLYHSMGTASVHTSARCGLGIDTGFKPSWMLPAAEPLSICSSSHTGLSTMWGAGCLC